MRKKLIFLTLLPLVALALALVGCNNSGSGHADHPVAAQKYHCPMHPTYVSDKPGDCPICNMKLVPIKADQAVSASKTAFACPMHPEVVSNAPALCPDC
ncbi:MAG TPA: heavy metal-binding domain-containing protein, partial [Candidatus Sulfotelmatobacter sp.]|nr:heavy metal-binding domain-containing protein [Candidatus Sulfotelmatobacter sp.]